MDPTGLTYTIQVDITPKPAARPRFSSKGRVYNDPSYKAWLKEFADLVREQWDNDVLQRISHMDITINGTTRRGDLDNHAKSILDGLVHARVLRNDNLAVLDSLNLNFLRVEGEEPWIKIKIYL